MAAEQGIELLVFPECTLTGYVFKNFEEAFKYSETVPGESTKKIERICNKFKITTVVGLLEEDNGKLYNTCVLITPEGLIGKYRKTHTLCLGVDRYVSPGENLQVFQLSQGKMGILICYDMRFPEPARVLALKGAQVILNPANLPMNAEVYANFLNRTRACENRVFIINANRVGEERGTQFIGRSQIIDCSGKIIAEGSGVSEEIIKGEIILKDADVKHIVNVPGEYEFDIFKDRRPEIYEEIIKIY
jgi:predicted amidohydrolase